MHACSIELLNKYQLHFFYIPAGHKVERYYTDSERHPRPRSEFIPFYVRMNAQISETKKDRATKFVGNISYKCTQLKLDLEFRYDYFRAPK